MNIRNMGGVIAVWAIAGAAMAGPLDPPVGPVAPSNKTLAEVEPRIAVNAVNTPGDADATPSLYKITQPGSYYLTGNVTGVNGKRGIEITASGVTLDLNGFDVVGVPGSFDGIQVTDVGYTNITIRNGSVRSWVGNGINLNASNAQNCSVIDVRAYGNAQSGIKVGNDSIVKGCVAQANLFGSGIVALNGCRIIDCVVGSQQSGTGAGITAASTAVVSGCQAYGNVGVGIVVGQGSAVSNCSCVANGAGGITAGEGSTVTACAVNTNGLVGIALDVGCVVEGCTAERSGTSGISGAAGCRIGNCVSRMNATDGIVVAADCIVTGNACTANGTAGGTASGIHATGNGNRIDGNTAGGGPRGIDVGGTNNVIVRNTCRGNTGLNYNIVAANLFGTIVDRTAPSGNAVAGNTATSTMASQDPMANFAH